jgi:serpin B
MKLFCVILALASGLSIVFLVFGQQKEAAPSQSDTHIDARNKDLAALGPSQEAQPTVKAADLQALVQGNNEFAFDLYARLSQEEGNIGFSPYSISTALAMTYAGARGATAEEMAAVLRFQLGQERLHPAFAALATNLQQDAEEDQPYRLHVANALWGQRGFRFVPRFLQLIHHNYNGGFREVDFFGHTEEARKTINSWVEKQTNNNIKELLRQGVVTQDTCLVLANALYFKGNWETPFAREATKDAEFEKTPLERFSVPMMAIAGKRFNYCLVDGCQWLELPYQGKRFSMVVVLPQTKGDLAKIEQTLTPAVMRKAIANLSEHQGSVFLPRFKTTKAYSLVQVLTTMGIVLAFTGQADFSGIGPGLRIAAVEHKAYIDVDEVGTEAAAATVVVMSYSLPPPFSFRADHPFLVLIRDRQTGSILFQGRVVDPRQ